MTASQDKFFFDEARRQTAEQSSARSVEMRRRAQIVVDQSLKIAFDGTAPMAETPADFGHMDGEQSDAFYRFADEMLHRILEDSIAAKAGGYYTWHREVLKRIWNAFGTSDDFERQEYLLHAASTCLAWVWYIDTKRAAEGKPMGNVGNEHGGQDAPKGRRGEQ